LICALIIAGNLSTDSGIWNIGSNTIKKANYNIKADQYYDSGEMILIKDIAYAIGSTYGHINMYNFKTKTTEAIDFLAAYL